MTFAEFERYAANFKIINPPFPIEFKVEPLDWMYLGELTGPQGAPELVELQKQVDTIHARARASLNQQIELFLFKNREKFLDRTHELVYSQGNGLSNRCIEQLVAIVPRGDLASGQLPKPITEYDHIVARVDFVTE
jgi:hypothetical protein